VGSSEGEETVLRRCVLVLRPLAVGLLNFDRQPLASVQQPAVQGRA